MGLKLRGCQIEIPGPLPDHSSAAVQPFIEHLPVIDFQLKALTAQPGDIGQALGHLSG